MISATTRLVALLGHPLAHSLSPRMHNAAFAARGLDWAYVACDVAPERLREAVVGIAALGFAGANVTIPHKERVVELCDELDAAATRARSVNTLVIRDGRILGSTTDGEAVVASVEAAGATALILGAGGAAKAVAAALENAGARAVRLASRGGEWPPDASVASLVVNATPVTDELLVEPRQDQQIVDLAYRGDGRPTTFVSAARAAGCERVVDGLDILVRQGAASFERWTGIAAPVDVMVAAVIASG